MEVAGLPLTNNPGDSSPHPISITQGLLIKAVDALADAAPDLAIRLVLRWCNSDTDKTLERVLARTRVARLPEDSARILSEMCESVINYALPRLNTADTPPLINPWVRRASVALEVLSRLVLRLPSDSVAATLELALDCLKNSVIRGNVLFGHSVSNLLRRSWDTLCDEHRARHALSLLAMPFEGEDGLAANFTYQAPGSLVSEYEVANVRSLDNENQFRDVINFLLSSLNSEDNRVHGKAAIRLLTLVNAGCLTADETDDAANALWAKDDPIPGSPTSTTLLHYVYFALPEMNPGQAECSFRKKWLATDKDLGEDMTIAGSVLEQVGKALDMSDRHKYSLPLSSEEQKYLMDCVLKVAENLSKGARASKGPLPPTIIQGIDSTLVEIEIPKDIAEQLYEVVSAMREVPNAGKHHPLLELSGMREQQADFVYSVMLGLIKAMPDRVEEIAVWIRLGLTSDDDLQVKPAMSTLQSWMSASEFESNAIIPPHEDLVREIGVVIATRRRVALPHALDVANWVFESGDTTQRETISQLVLQGLSYLIEELRYDREDEDVDYVPTIRFLCAQLAKSMAQKGYAESSVICRWVDIAKEDPLPEVRHIFIPGS